MSYKSYMRTGFIGWHVLPGVCITGRHVLENVMSYWKSCLSGGNVFHETHLMGVHVLGETCLLEDKSCRRTFLVGGHIYYGRQAL